MGALGLVIEEIKEERSFDLIETMKAQIQEIPSTGVMNV